MAGQDVWHDMMRVYARHLEQCGDQRMAALYHLALGDVFEAVQVYARAGRFREAILLARVRLGVSYVGHRYFSSRACERRICAGESWLVHRVAWCGVAFWDSLLVSLSRQDIGRLASSRSIGRSFFRSADLVMMIIDVYCIILWATDTSIHLVFGIW